MYGPLCTEFYDASKPSAPAEELDVYHTILDKNETILEAMCGSGRLLIPLLQNGYRIDGIDVSADMLQSCQTRAAHLGFDPNLIKSSLEDAQLNRQYDTVIIAIGSFQLFYPRAQAFTALEALKRLIKPNGRLILDTFVPWTFLNESVDVFTEEREVTIGENHVIKMFGEDKPNKEEQYYFETNTYTKIVDGRVVATEKEQMNICWYYRYELELILERHGFRDIVSRPVDFSDSKRTFFISSL